MELENLKINFPCPECHQEFQVSLCQLLGGGVIICPACQATNVETEMVDIARELDELGRSLKNLKRCLDRHFHPNS